MNDQVNIECEGQHLSNIALLLFAKSFQIVGDMTSPPDQFAVFLIKLNNVIK